MNFSEFLSYFQYPFVRNAMIVGVLIALCSSLLGVTLVLKRYSFIGDGLSHAAFGAVAVATIMKLTDTAWLVLPVTIVCAVLLLRVGQNAKLKGDAAIAVISVSALALGYLLLNVFSASANLAGDVCSSLFGAASFLTLTGKDVLWTAILSALVIVAFLLCYNRIFAVTFDETFAKASGVRVGFYNLLIAVMIAVVVVAAMNLVGSLLISALLVFPALSAMRLFHSFKAVTLCSAVLSVICTALGLAISVLASTPPGATVVTVDLLVFLLCIGISAFRKKA